MESYSKCIPLLLSCTLFEVLQGQRVATDAEVIGYQNHDVTLSCNYIHRNKIDKLNQVQWTWRNNTSKESPILIIINHFQFGTNVSNTFLRGRVSFIKKSLTTDASIIIKDVKLSDQGVYICDYKAYPSGAQTGVTVLNVKEGKPPALSSAMTAGIVTLVIILIILLVSVGYIFLIKKRNVVSTSANYNTQTPDDLKQNQELIYADVTVLRPAKVNRNASLKGHIEYAAVSFSGRSETTSQHGLANQKASSAYITEHRSVYAEVIKDY